MLCQSARQCCDEASIPFIRVRPVLHPRRGSCQPDGDETSWLRDMIYLSWCSTQSNDCNVMSKSSTTLPQLLLFIGSEVLTWFHFVQTTRDTPQTQTTRQIACLTWAPISEDFHWINVSSSSVLFCSDGAITQYRLGSTIVISTGGSFSNIFVPKHFEHLRII